MHPEAIRGRKKRKNNKEYNVREVERVRQWRIENREKYLEDKRAYKKKYNLTENGKMKRRQHGLKHLYGITLDDYDRMLVEQNNCCAICKSPEPGHLHFSVDHDHKTGKLRGLLCNNCNRGLGMLGDNVERIKRALEYLTSKKEKNATSNTNSRP